MYSLFLFVVLVLPGVAICVAGFSRVEGSAHGVFALTAEEILYGVTYPFLGLLIVATMAHILFVIGLLQINRVFANRGVITLATVCLVGDLAALTFNALLFIGFVFRETRVGRGRGRGDVGTEDRIMAAFLIGMPALLSLVLFVLFMFLVQKTREVVAKAIAERTGVGYLLK